MKSNNSKDIAMDNLVTNNCKTKRIALESLAFLVIYVVFKYAFGLTTLTAAFPALAIVSALNSGSRIYRRMACQVPGAPGPNPWPVLGSLHLLDGYKVYGL